eukprot:CAMPEP_0175038810 /NCGR_PEP_ID=MMETSP0052_2-20121109/110_1 /TAXON_ID=51329 ORGANISM="Polytomella parva, Strain SAG 63-3" /NCGR_SAMPLE_ID=MMETSP0052_2 /ASSEMBLY_ACC=CAM_ASM_000194 /LENGTH=86 /DNA_ID=CAMNT_0016300343 /DNA_START=109 /DNA_END=369 /DNA_ORIENTATION=-
MVAFGGFRFPLDAKILAVPAFYCTAAFCVMVARIPIRDPEANPNSDFYDDEVTSTKIAQKYDTEFRSIFTERVKRMDTSVFNNRGI